MDTRFTDVEIQYDASDYGITDDTVTKDLDYTSDEDGEFTTNPSIDIVFASAHSLNGVTVNFDGDAPLELSCTWTHEYGTSTKTYNINRKNFVIYQTITGCTAIHIEFTKALPEHKVYVDSVKYGVYLIWSKDEVKTATLVLATDRIAERLSINTLTFDVVDPDELTNPGNKEGLHNYLQKRKPVYPYEIIDGQKIKLGDFFLDTFNYEKNICKITAVSYMSILDTIQYDKGTVYNNVAAGTVLADIFDVAGISNYTIDADTASQPLFGALPPCTCKEALRQVLFVCHSVIDTSDANDIKIEKSTTGIFGELTKEEKFSTKVTKKDYISGIKINYKHYGLDSETKEVINDVYSAGTHHIAFSTPYADYSIVGGTLNSSGTFYVDFTVSGTQQVIVTAKQYNSFDNSVQVTYEAEEDESIKEFNSTLCNITTARELCAKLLNYYANRFEIEVRCMAQDTDMGSRLEIYNPTDDFDNYVGIITSKTIDLTGGFIETAKYIGYADTSSSIYYMDNEIINDDSQII